eukprot:scaffold10846_cov32-Tisochrysis_lutea.AAC.5
MVLRLERDVACKHVNQVAACDVTRGERRLLDQRHAMLAAIEDVLAVMGREDDDAGEEAPAQHSEEQPSHLSAKEVEKRGIVAGKQQP